MYTQPPTAEQIGKLCYELNQLLLDPKPDTRRLKDALHDAQKAVIWKIAQVNNTTPDHQGRIITAEAS